LKSRERVISILRGDKSQIATVNTAGTYTAEFMRRTDAMWPEAHKDAEKMARLASAAHKFCGLENATVPFDMVVEAEVLGAPINFFEGTLRWPSARSFTVKNAADVKAVSDVQSSGRVQIVAEAIRRLKLQQMDMAVNAFMVPPFTSVSSYLMDTMSFYVAMKRNPKLIKEILDAVLPVYVEIAKTYEEAGADMITLHEMGASTDNISPGSFQEFSAPYVAKIVGAVKIPVVLNICGRADPIAAMMADTGVAGVAFDEKTDLTKVNADLAGRSTVIAGNLSPREVLHNGPVSKIEEYVRKAVDNGVSLVGAGCDFWIETPSTHIKAMVDYVNRIRSSG